MKKIYLMLLIFLAAAFISYAQDEDGMRPGRGPGKKLEELEKIKLIEVLNMNEETTLKFFSRRNAHREKMRELNDQLMDKTKQIEKLVNNDGDKQLKSAVKEYLELESRIPKERAEFINSLSDILNDSQIAKLVIFERKFREEIREILFRERRKDRHDDD